MTPPKWNIHFDAPSALDQADKTWSPTVVLGVLWRAVRNAGSYRDVQQVLKFPVYAELANDFPRFRFKYLTCDYLARGFTVATRASCFAHHYLWLHEKLPVEFVARILRQRIPLVEIEHDANRIEIDLSFWGSDKEGELSLSLKVNGERIFILSFTVVPGRVVRSGDPDVFLITRIQGEKGRLQQISLVYRLLHSTGPALLLLTVLEGIGEALSVGALACISATDQSFYSHEFLASFQSSYDKFFTIRGLTKNDSNVFLSPIPTAEKPFDMTNRNHRRRTLKRRELKRLVRESVRRIVSDASNGEDVRPLKVRLGARPRDPLAVIGTRDESSGAIAG
jgi:uncharacterized protein VirK/YbjX